MVVEPLRRIEADLVFAGARKIDWLNEPFVCRMPTCAPSGALGLRAVKPLPLPEIPDLPVNVQMVPVGSYWNVPVPREEASKPASPKVCVPPMLKGELKTEAEEKPKSAVAVMFAPAERRGEREAKFGIAIAIGRNRRLPDERQALVT